MNKEEKEICFACSKGKCDWCATNVSMTVNCECEHAPKEKEEPNS